MEGVGGRPIYSGGPVIAPSAHVEVPIPLDVFVDSTEVTHASVHEVGLFYGALVLGEREHHREKGGGHHRKGEREGFIERKGGHISRERGIIEIGGRAS